MCTDVLAEVLEGLRLRGSWCGRPKCTAPWEIRAAAGPTRFYAVTEGFCRLVLEGVDPVDLNAGDLIFVTHGQSHSLHDGSRVRIAPFQEAVPLLADQVELPQEIGGGGTAATIVCGAFAFESDARLPLLSALPPILHCEGEAGRPGAWLDGILRLLMAESQLRAPGAQAIINRLVHILFTQAVRAAVTKHAYVGGEWLRAAVDPEIGPALGLIHSHPESPWTVASLADQVGMSRSVFAAKFALLVGMPPLRYVVDCRMREASEMLRTGRKSVKEIASNVGYRSQAAFRTAFKRWAGSAPGEFRRDGIAVEV